MPFEIIRNDITCMTVDAIVNTANPLPVIGGGTDHAIHEAAGPQLLQARQKIGALEIGQAAITPAFRLNAQYVIHTVGPVWQGGGCGEAESLRHCYERSLRLAWQHGCRSIAFPLISTGVYRFPREQALQIAVSVFSAFLMEHEMLIYLVVWDRDSVRVSEKLFRSITRFIDENYITLHPQPLRPRATQLSSMPNIATEDLSAPVSDIPPNLEELLRQADAGFTETLLKRIDESGKKDPEIYTRANITRQHFSKIRNNPQYKPSKPTAVAFAIALELNLEQTMDLIGRAGYTLTKSSIFDLIILYFLRQGNYDMMQINSTLFEFDQPLLGGSQ